MQQRFPEIIGSRPPIIREVEIGGRGTFYRVRIPASSQDEAADLCARLKSAGADCFVGPSEGT